MQHKIHFSDCCTKIINPKDIRSVVKLCYLTASTENKRKEAGLAPFKRYITYFHCSQHAIVVVWPIHLRRLCQTSEQHNNTCSKEGFRLLANDVNSHFYLSILVSTSVTLGELSTAKNFLTEMSNAGFIPPRNFLEMLSQGLNDSSLTVGPQHPFNKNAPEFIPSSCGERTRLYSMSTRE